MPSPMRWACATSRCRPRLSACGARSNKPRCPRRPDKERTMYEFNYHKASSVADAAALLARNPDAKLLAGGQTLIAAMKLRLAAPPDLIDLGAIKELSGIRSDGGALMIGAMTRHAEVAASKQVIQSIPALANLAAS